MRNRKLYVPKLIKPLDEVPALRGGAQHICDIGDGYKQVTAFGTSQSTFALYLSDLEAAGFTLYVQNTISGNLYATYTKGSSENKITVHAYYAPTSGETRIIAKKGDIALPATEAPTYNKVTNLTYTILVDYDSSGNLGPDVGGGSLGGIVQLEDGSFLVYDGGNNHSKVADQIYNKLYELAPDKNNIVIRAWIFSHAHSDHVGGFQAFVSKYGSKTNVTVESFLFNFCDTPEQTETLSSTALFTTVRNLVSATYPNATVYKALTGQIYYFAGLQMEVLATMSDFIPLVIGQEAVDADLNNGDGNTMSIVVRLITNAGKTVMLTGDATNIVLDDMCDRYGEAYLKTDVLTMPHHALNQDRYRARNATENFYDHTKPTIAILPHASRIRLAAQGDSPNEVNVYLQETYHPTIYDSATVQTIDLTTLTLIP